MKLVFWTSSLLIVLAYAGYPIYLYLRATFCPRPTRRGDITPTVTILLVVRNEEKNLPSKLLNLAGIDYPSSLIETVIVSDGSTDHTNDILTAWQNPNGRAIMLSAHQGKASALNCGLAEARGEIICFTDARQMIDSSGLKNLVGNFADGSVGCVSGELMMERNTKLGVADGAALYWQVEKKVRYWEALCESSVGATGAFYAVRRKLVSAIPLDTILDDVYIPFQVVRQGQRVVFEPRAVVWDHLRPTAKQEFHRKLRTLAGNYQLLQIAPWLLARSNPIRLQFVLHKLLRLLVPFALMAVFISTIWIRQSVYGVALLFQLFFYALAILRFVPSDWGPLSRLSSISAAFIVLNVAAVVALVYFIRGKKVAWAR